MPKSTPTFPDISQRLLPLLFMIAFPGEAEILNHIFPFRRMKKLNRITLYRVTDHPVFLTIIGMDIEKKSDELENLLGDLHPSLLINYGICGGLDLSLPLFQNFLVNQVKALHQPLLSLSALAPNLYDILQSRFPTGSLLTSDSVIQIPKLRDELFLHTGCQLVDREGYYLLRIAHRHSVPLILLKQPIDYCNAETMDNFRQQKARWQKGLKEGLLKLFDIFEQYKLENF